MRTLKPMRPSFFLTAIFLSFATAMSSAVAEESDGVFEETNGQVVVEAEHFSIQEKDEVRKWYPVHPDRRSVVEPDGDEPHFESAGGQAYLELLPDSRRTHDDPLIHGENFSNQPGKMGVLHYRVYVHTPGIYYVWVRAFSTTTEDNGLHVGMNGRWPASGQRMQWCEGKHSWRWESKQRTQEQHCGVAHAIFLEINEPGLHTVSFSMREDGFEFDQWMMTLDRHFVPPDNVLPESPQLTSSIQK